MTPNPADLAKHGATGTFYRPCRECGASVDTINGVEQPHVHDSEPSLVSAYWSGHDAAMAEFERSGR